MGNALRNAFLHNFNFALASGKELLVNLFYKMCLHADSDSYSKFKRGVQFSLMEN